MIIMLIVNIAVDTVTYCFISKWYYDMIWYDHNRQNALSIDQNVLMILLLCLRRQTLLHGVAAVYKTVKRIIKRCKVLQ